VLVKEPQGSASNQAPPLLDRALERAPALLSAPRQNWRGSCQWQHMMLSQTQGGLDGHQHTETEIHKTSRKAFAQQASVKICSSDKVRDFEIGRWPSRLSPVERR
jgi:hypothetical protein